MKKRENHIKYRYYIKGILTLLSPTIIASGEDELADLQIVRDWDGNIIIPGTTIAGNIRCLLQEKSNKELIDKYFGSNNENSGHSLFSFFDATEISVTTDIRDGIKLNNLTKTIEKKSKYDYEIINNSSTFEFRLNAVSRENTDNKEMEAVLSEIINILEKGEFTIGGKTSRGFGKVKLFETKILKLDMTKKQENPAKLKNSKKQKKQKSKKMSEKQRWIDFKWEDLDLIKSNAKLKSKKKLFSNLKPFTISASFTIPNSLIIKSYSTNPDDIDSVSMTSKTESFANKQLGLSMPASYEPIIPGTSWNGAIRHALENAGRELDKHEEMLKLLKETFGWVDDKNKSKNAIASKVIINESKIEEGKMITYVRNKVDRFTGGVVNSALFDEKAVYGGKVLLECKINSAKDYQKGMLILAVKELQNGIQTVGGGSNIGRGRLKEKAFNISQENQEKYLNALANKLMESE